MLFCMLEGLLLEDLLGTTLKGSYQWQKVELHNLSQGHPSTEDMPA